jgi:hypothetical protein
MEGRSSTKRLQHLEGKNRKFTSAYFGWIRFKANSETVEPLLEEVAGRGDILRHILIKLTKVEEENPFRFHPALESFKKVVTTIDEAELVETEAVAEGEAVVEDAEVVKTPADDEVTA